ncbi:hypothetical protein E6B08_23205 [Pseudomonas putida]|uniref:Uncharacterized protein n=1 Tax=Pseudomonas putida TaxID=303 RepID=A0A4D6XEQ1_PSEPU|nr:hypothetical protein [Pseudomonas putida]QCI14074.1 hypothetical protein E6B08_23205 [Pseudomonas putida]
MKKHAMKRDIRIISLDKVKLDQENVRFGNDVAQNQREAIKLMLADPSGSFVKLCHRIFFTPLAKRVWL